MNNPALLTYNSLSAAEIRILVDKTEEKVQIIGDMVQTIQAYIQECSHLRKIIVAALQRLEQKNISNALAPEMTDHRDKLNFELKQSWKECNQLRCELGEAIDTFNFLRMRLMIAERRIQ